ncbi:MAG: universal stress protein [Chlorobi bacterium]|nr:universal stress protein [Chlorobiota bacterium]
MKRILIPVDFSKDSVNAVKYGINVANKLSADVRLIHVRTGDNYAPEFAGNEVMLKINDQLEIWIKELLERVKVDYYVAGGKIDWKIREGNVFQEIANQAKYDDTSLIVVASHGASGFQDKFIGSNAYRLVANAPCPVIVVRHGVVYDSDIEKIIIPVDFSKESTKIVPVVAGLATVYHSKIILVGLRDSGFKHVLLRIKSQMALVERYIQEHADIEVEKVVVSGGNLAKKLITFAEEANVDVLAIRIHHSSNPFENIFRPFTNCIINNSSVPVLVVPTTDM